MPNNVTVEEFVAGIDRLFVPLDANGNGRIEWSEAEVTVTRDVFDAADTNANGSLSKGEFDAQLRKDFQTADRDGDGVLDLLGYRKRRKDRSGLLTRNSRGRWKTVPDICPRPP